MKIREHFKQETTLDYAKNGIYTQLYIEWLERFGEKILAIAKTRIHMICGICGSNEYLKYKIINKGRCDNEGKEHPAVFITCENCASLTSLDEIIKLEGEI